MNAITRKEAALLDAPLVTFQLNGRDVTGKASETLIQVAQREGIEIPRLCYKEGMEAVGNCRACMVEIAGERVLAPSCCRAPTPGMKVITDNERVLKSQQMVLELLLSDMPQTAYTRHNEVDVWACKLGVGKPRFEAREQVAQTSRTRPSLFISTPASSAHAACARAATSRSTTSSASHFAAIKRRSCLTWTTRWARRPASRVANACRRARPAR